MLLWAQGGIHRNSCVHPLGQLGNAHEVAVGAESNCLQCGARQLYLNNLLIWHAGHKKVLFVLVWVELDAVRYLPVGEAGDTLACGGREGRGANWKSQLQNNPQWLFRKVHSSCLKFKDTGCNFQRCMLCPCRQRQLRCNTENSVFPSFSRGESPQEWCDHYR